MQGETFEPVRRSIEDSGFLAFLEQHPLCRAEFVEAIKFAPNVKEDFYTILSERGAMEKLLAFVDEDPWMKRMLA